MNQRDRLIELIKNSRTNEALDMLTVDIDTAIDMPHGDEYLADHLISNGVIVPQLEKGTVVILNHLDGNMTAYMAGDNNKLAPLTFGKPVGGKTVTWRKWDRKPVYIEESYPEIMRHFTEVE